MARRRQSKRLQQSKIPSHRRPPDSKLIWGPLTKKKNRIPYAKQRASRPQRRETPQARPQRQWQQLPESEPEDAETTTEQPPRAHCYLPLEASERFPSRAQSPHPFYSPQYAPVTDFNPAYSGSVEHHAPVHVHSTVQPVINVRTGYPEGDLQDDDWVRPRFQTRGKNRHVGTRSILGEGLRTIGKYTLPVAATLGLQALGVPPLVTGLASSFLKSYFSDSPQESSGFFDKFSPPPGFLSNLQSQGSAQPVPPLAPEPSVPLWDRLFTAAPIALFLTSKAREGTERGAGWRKRRLWKPFIPLVRRDQPGIKLLAHKSAFAIPVAIGRRATYKIPNYSRVLVVQQLRKERAAPAPAPFPRAFPHSELLSLGRPETPASMRSQPVSLDAPSLQWDSFTDSVGILEGTQPQGLWLDSLPAQGATNTEALLRSDGEGENEALQREHDSESSDVFESAQRPVTPVSIPGGEQWLQGLLKEAEQRNETRPPKGNLELQALAGLGKKQGLLLEAMDRAESNFQKKLSNAEKLLDNLDDFLKRSDASS
ncbi:TPA_asm: LO2-3 [Leatherback sea turtle adomavirus]|nr:TPA_asm: LO2-3 [Leatherback sea turtle adomavirus]